MERIGSRPRSPWRAAVATGGLALVLASCGDGALEVERLLATYDSLAASVSWPGFVGSRIPIAVHDGARTWLIRHPDPPVGFRRVGDRADLWIGEGAIAPAPHGAREVGGFPTAVLSVASRSEGRLGRREAAAALVHRAFHVHQRRRHPGWLPDAADLLVYPTDDPEGLRLRRLETTALRRALEPEPPDSVRRLCWSRGWTRVRVRRIAGLPADAVAYERRVELWEGLALHIEAVALGDFAPPDLPARGYPPEGVSSRAGDVGCALAWLLDRVRPEWRADIGRGRDTTLGGALEAALAGTAGKVCLPTPDEWGRARAVALADIERLRERRVERRRGYERRPGWRVEVVVATGRPLRLSAFDATKLERLGQGALLHGGSLRLERDGGRVEVHGLPVLTEPAGGQAVSAGVGRLLVTGLPREPEASRSGGVIRLRAEGLEARFPGGTLGRGDRTVRIELDSSASAPEDGRGEGAGPRRPGRAGGGSQIADGRRRDGRPSEEPDSEEETGGPRHTEDPDDRPAPQPRPRTQ